jgi:hypothetical protein
MFRIVDCKWRGHGDPPHSLLLRARHERPPALYVISLSMIVRGARFRV